MGKKFKSFLAPAGAIVGNLIAPGIGGVIGGAAGGALSGGGIKAAGLGALSGGAIGFAPQIGAFANEGLGLGLQGAGSIGALGGALGGGVVGALSGDGLKGAGMGALTGGIGGYLSGGGLGEIGDSLGFGSPGDVASNGLRVGKLYNVYNGTPAEAAFLQNAQNAAGIGSVGAKSGGLSGLTSLLPGGGSGGSMFLTGLSALNQYGTAGDMEKKMLEAQRRAEGVMQPYQQTGLQANQMLSDRLGSGALGGGFTMDNFQADPGYQFRKSEGEAALARAQSARGGVFSGQAMREALDLNQQLADQAYNDAFSRFNTDQQRQYGMLAGASGAGQQAAGGIAGIYDNMGDIGANATLGRSNAITGGVSDLMGGDIIGYRADGTPITRQSALLGLM